MESMFIEARSDIDIMPPKKELARLPKNIGLVTTVQHAHKIAEV